ncbi:MAG: hypothetical protein AD742_18415 [Methylibium sp. NZG]|nr:MAG: hypothetical protein AD742_18415 [Methylibium sp. NZG]
MQLDHLVLAARSLAEGVAWCEATLGIVPGPGGEHAFMGTHNRLFGIGSAAFPRAYFEIIAINPDAGANAAPTAGTPRRPRWFDLDDPALQRALLHGPQLIHWVARCDDVRALVTELRAAGIDRGEVVRAERQTPHGLLRWQITLRADGRRLFGGALPTLIQWGAGADSPADATKLPSDGSPERAAGTTANLQHPTDTMPASGVALTHLAVLGLPAEVTPLLPAGIEALASSSAPALRCTLLTPRGPVTLQSPTLQACDVQP